MPSVTVAEITAQRRLDGVEFTIRSEPLERLFRYLSDGNTSVVSATRVARPPRNPPPESDAEDSGDRPPMEPPSESPSVIYSGATRRYTLPLVENGIPRQLNGFNCGRFDLWGNQELVHSRGPRLNLSPLTAVGISEGISIMIPTVVSDKLLQEYTQGVQQAVRQIYIDYIADRRHTITITSEHSID